MGFEIERRFLVGSEGWRDAATRIGHIGAEHGIVIPRQTRNPDTAIVEECPTATAGREQLVACRIVDDPMHHLTAMGQSN